VPEKKTAKKSTSKKATSKKATRKMSDEHKQALANGRAQGRAVREYLAALDQSSKPGRRVSKDELEKRLAETQEKVASESDPTKRLDLIQKRLDIEERLAEQQEEVDLGQLEKDFVGAAKEYAERKGISYSAFREAGVPAAVLKQAGIARTRRTN
jgi:histidinol dehydrogenase